MIQHHVSGQLKVAPEHICDAVLTQMGKPENSVYERFRKKYAKLNEQAGLKQFLVPYLMSSHPGSTLKEAIALAEYLRDLGYMPQQVQDFYPTPSTVSTVMYYTGLNPVTMKPVYVCKNPHEKAMQRALIQYRNPANRELVLEALQKANRMDLVGFDKKCLIRPERGQGGWNHGASANGKNTVGKSAGGKNGSGRPGTKPIGKDAKKATDQPRKKKTIRNVHKKK